MRGLPPNPPFTFTLIPLLQDMVDATSIRKQCRLARRNLTPQQQQLHATKAADIFRTSGMLYRGDRVALYLANDGELNPLPIQQQLSGMGKQLFLPVLRSNTNKSLWFAVYKQNEKLVLNQYGIPEPDLKRHKPLLPWHLDILLMPLVSFDEQGNRIGMGGGYYDRTLAYLRRRNAWRKPILVGLAHECQKSFSLQKQPWDVHLNYVITEKQLYEF
jgi:5-formyltetrahydrofolate cyclo-ligase